MHPQARRLNAGGIISYYFQAEDTCMYVLTKKYLGGWRSFLRSHSARMDVAIISGSVDILYMGPVSSIIASNDMRTLSHFPWLKIVHAPKHTVPFPDCCGYPQRTSLVTPQNISR
jgi:hypothetical protein